MKIKIDNDKIVDVKEVEISGDITGWDLWYVVDGEGYHDLRVEEIDSDKRVDLLIKHMDNFVEELSKTHDENIRYNVKINLD